MSRANWQMKTKDKPGINVPGTQDVIPARTVPYDRSPRTRKSPSVMQSLKRLFESSKTKQNRIKGDQSLQPKTWT